MDIQLLEKHFEKIGARVKFRQIVANRRDSAGIDIRNDKSGEFFDIRLSGDEPVEYEIIDLQKDLRHLLLLARRARGGKEKFLCGHDERHWFVCAVPGRSVSNVAGAMEALQPVDVRFQINAKMKRIKNRFTRRNEAFLRQGEWFFIQTPDLMVEESFAARIYKNEPISRGWGSKPHICEEVFRTHGETVMVCSCYPAGVTLKQYNHILKSNPKAAKWNWRAMQRNASVYARGRVRHPDHKTIVLDGCHRVLMNTENEAPGMRHVVFLD
jgi:hypothetical protein